MDTKIYSKLFADLATVLIPDDATMAGFLADQLKDEADLVLARHRKGDAFFREVESLDHENELLHTTCPACGAAL